MLMKLNIADFAELERYRDAKDLIALEMRGSIVSALTGVSSHHVKKIWYDVHKKTPPCGQLPAGVHVFVKDPVIAANLSGFVAFCIMKYGDAKTAMTARNIISARTAYSWVSQTTLDVTAAYYALRDVASGMVHWRYCRGCRAFHMVHLRTFQMRNCPFCRLAATARKAA